MGVLASTIITHLIIFIAVISIATGVIIGFKNFADQSQSSLTSRTKELNNHIKTAIKIELISYDNTTNETKVYVRNIGSTTLDPSYVDIYIDGFRFSRNQSQAYNRGVEVLPDTDITDPGLWNPKEQLYIIARKHLSIHKTHEVTVTTQYEGSDTDTFST